MFRYLLYTPIGYKQTFGVSSEDLRWDVIKVDRDFPRKGF